MLSGLGPDSHPRGPPPYSTPPGRRSRPPRSPGANKRSSRAIQPREGAACRGAAQAAGPPGPPLTHLAAARPRCGRAGEAQRCRSRSGAYHVAAPGSGSRLRAAARHDRLRLLCFTPGRRGGGSANPFGAGPGRAAAAAPLAPRPAVRAPGRRPLTLPFLHTHTHACTHACMHACHAARAISHGHTPRRVAAPNWFQACS